MMITYLSVGAILVKKDEPEAGTPWKVFEVEDGIRLQRVGQPDNVWKGESIEDVNRAFTPENGDEMTDYIPANVKSVADIGYTQVHLKALREHKADRNALPTFSGGAMATLPTAHQPQESRVHVIELDATEVSAMTALAGGINAARSRPFNIVTAPESPLKIDHELKVDPERLAEIIAGTKTHEIRVFDREFKVGNTLKLNEYDRSANEYTGQLAIVKVTNITAPGSYGLPANLGVMSIELVKAFDFKREFQSEVSMADVLANNKQMHIGLSSANTLSFADSVALIKSMLPEEAKTKQTPPFDVVVDEAQFLAGSIHSPSNEFRKFSQDAVSDELNRARPACQDEMARRLWAAAQYDGFINTGAVASMKDGGGFERVDYRPYKRVIDLAIARLAEAGF
jgi:Domain of unknown function (DUF3850)